MSKNKYVQHKHYVTKNNNGDKVEVFYHKHYDNQGYQVTKINNVEYNSGKSWETLENAVKSTEQEKEQ
jgi:hypothetical protein